GYKTDKEIDKLAKNIYMNSKLAPFANRIDRGKYEFEGKKYSLTKNFPHEDNAIHGLVDDKKFEIEEIILKKDSASAVLKYDYNAWDKGFPFEFTVRIKYGINIKSGMTIETEITNTGDRIMPYTDGWHHYFMTGSKVDNCILQIDSNEKYKFSKRMIPEGKIKNDEFKKGKLIENQFLDECFILNTKGKNKISTKLIDRKQKFTLEIWQNCGKGKYNYLQVYTPEHRRTIAIEPMSSPPNAFNTKVDLIKIKPREKVLFKFGVNING
ncbi:MAG TPA: aldose 1-epimerase, partial [Candidatus Dojkabacteria bacterium]